MVNVRLTGETAAVSNGEVQEITVVVHVTAHPTVEHKIHTDELGGRSLPLVARH